MIGTISKLSCSENKEGNTSSTKGRTGLYDLPAIKIKAGEVKTIKLDKNTVLYGVYITDFTPLHSNNQTLTLDGRCNGESIEFNVKTFNSFWQIGLSTAVPEFRIKSNTDVKLILVVFTFSQEIININCWR